MAPPVIERARNLPLQTPPDVQWTSSHSDMTKPTYSLNLVYRRSGTARYIQTHVRTINERLSKNHESFWLALKATEKNELFYEIRKRYLWHMAGFWRMTFSLKTLSTISLLSYEPNGHADIKDVLLAFDDPKKVDQGTTEWNQWVFCLRKVDQRHALEFVEGWNGARIAIAGIIPWLFSTLVGMAWSVIKGYYRRFHINFSDL
ncbi:MAG: hypothetical protein MMC33_000107 [Icmadophila ericetorum]|nr:hypothetical protein [Icmadophila ericetorum]